VDVASHLSHVGAFHAPGVALLEQNYQYDWWPPPSWRLAILDNEIELTAEAGIL
jgi:hypothetical protein